MTASDDRVDAVVEAFIDHLEGLGEAPALDDLDVEERARAEALIGSLEAGRGIDPYASRPSLEQLLAGTPLETALEAHDVDPRDDLLHRIRDRLTLYAPFHVDIWPDNAAAAIGIGSDFVALVSAQRLRIQIRSDVEPSRLASLDPAAVAGPLYGAFPDTAGVIVVHPGDELSSIAVDPFDTEPYIETPAGTVARPVMHRPIMPLEDTVRAYLDEIAPALDTTVDLAAMRADDVDPAAVARDAARRAVEHIVQDGRRAKIDAKRATWSDIGEPEIDAIGELVLDAITGLDHATLESRVDALAGAT
ncbi:MAG TPA: hypothetical protein VK923_05760 [Euzebyales bacterium]|jgi:hypothetical protein|nr:hypothetical protein [Euzebyales bacterium]